MQQIEDTKLYITPYRVSTITCNADIGNNINLNLNVLFDNIVITSDDNNFIWIQYLKCFVNIGTLKGHSFY